MRRVTELHFKHLTVLDVLPAYAGYLGLADPEAAADILDREGFLQ